MANMRSFMRRLVGATRRFGEFVAIELVARVLYYTGILFLIGFARQRMGRRRLLIPMYHRICATPANSANLLAIQQGVPVQVFQQQLRIFRWFGPLLTLKEGFDHLHDPKRTCRSVIALTFDDGYRDTVAFAVPALRARSAKATVFPVVRTASGGRSLWWDELTDIVSRARTNGERFDTLLAGLNGCVSPATDRALTEAATSRAALAALLCDRFVSLSAAERQAAMSRLADRLGVRPNESPLEARYATWEELRWAAADICEIGGHTIDHPVLTFEDPLRVRAQVAGSRAVIEHMLAAPVHSFAYPNGRHDATVRALTAAAGYRCAVTVQAGVNYLETDPYELRRLPVHRERPFHLAFKLAFYGWVTRG